MERLGPCDHGSVVARRGWICIMEQIVFKANGQEMTVDSELTIDGFLSLKEIEPRTVAVEINGEALFRSEWSTRKLHQADNLEVIRVVAGG